MSRPGLALLTLVAAGFLSAQSSTTPEIRGTVLEVGPEIGLAGVEVTLTEFVPVDNDLQPRVFGTIFTDAQGKFLFKPNHLGDFRLNVKKADYTDATGEGPRGLYVVLKAEQPAQQFVFRLLQPASLTGRVVDEDGKPVSGFSVRLVLTKFVDVRIGNMPAVTDLEGNFTATGVIPGPYLVRIEPKGGTFVMASAFSEKEFQVVDHDVALSYWPGDVSDPDAALPMIIAPGQQASIGTITLRKTDYYRVHVSVASDCAPGETWSYGLFHPERDDHIFESAPCRKDFILRNLERGSYTLVISNQKETAEMRWAVLPLVINGRNVDAELILSPGTEVAGRLVIPDGVAPLASLNGTVVDLHPEMVGLRVTNTYFTPDEDGKFVAGRLPWSRYLVGLMGLRPSHYVKEIRYNGIPVPDGSVTLSPGAALEFVLDDHPASLSGTVMDGDNPAVDAMVILRKWPLKTAALDERSLVSYAARSGDEGRFQFSGLAPGEYEIDTLPADPYLSPELSHPMPSGERIRLERDDRKTVQLKLVRPPR